MKALLALVLTSFVFVGGWGGTVRPPENLDQKLLLPVPIIRQTFTYSCGPAALLGMLYYWQVTDEGEASLHAPLKLTPDGTSPDTMVDHAKRLGLRAEWRTGVTLEEIKAAIEREEPVMVDFQAWEDTPPPSYKNIWSSGHYAVVIGLDSKNIYFMDPSAHSSYAFLTLTDFMDRWHDVNTYAGKEVKEFQGALFISGERKLAGFPASMVKVD